MTAQRPRLSQSPLSLSCSSLSTAAALSARGSQSSTHGLLQHSSLFRQRELKPVLKSSVPQSSQSSPRSSGPTVSDGMSSGVPKGNPTPSGHGKHRRSGAAHGDGKVRQRSSPCPSASPSRNRSRVPPGSQHGRSAAAARRRPDGEQRAKACSPVRFPVTCRTREAVTTQQPQQHNSRTTTAMSSAPSSLPTSASSSVVGAAAASRRHADMGEKPPSQRGAQPEQTQQGAASATGLLAQQQQEQQRQQDEMAVRQQEQRQQMQQQRDHHSFVQRLQKELAVEAIASFLRDHGLSESAESLLALLRERGHFDALVAPRGTPGGAPSRSTPSSSSAAVDAGASAGRSFPVGLQRLTVTLGRIADGGWETAAASLAGAGVPEEATVPELLRRLSSAAPDVTAEPVPQPPWKRRFDAEFAERQACADQAQYLDAAAGAAANDATNAEFKAAGVLPTGGTSAASGSAVEGATSQGGTAFVEGQVAAGVEEVSQVVADAVAVEAAAEVPVVEAEAEAPPLPQPPPRQAASAHYLPMGQGTPEGFIDHDGPDEYRDDHDAGYRIREISEAELILELQQFAALNAVPVVMSSSAGSVVAGVGGLAQAAQSQPLRSDEACSADGEAATASSGANAKQAPVVDDELQEAVPTTSPRTELDGVKGLFKTAVNGFKGFISGSSSATGNGAAEDPLSEDANGAVAAAREDVATDDGNRETEGYLTSGAGSSVDAEAVHKTGSPRFGDGAAPETALAGAAQQPERQQRPSLAAQAYAAVAPDSAHAAAAAEAAASSLIWPGAVCEDDQNLQVSGETTRSQPSVAEERSVAAAADAAMAAAAQHQRLPQQQQLLQQQQLQQQQLQHQQQQQAYAASYAFQQQVALPHALPAKRKDRNRGPRPPFRHAASQDPFYPVQLDGIVYDSFPLRIVYERDSTGFEDSKEFPIRMNSIIAARYQVLAYLGSAAFSRAVQCLDLETNTMVCMKIIKNDKDFFDQSLDEIKLLKIIAANADNVDDKHCLRLVDCFYHKEHLIIVTELLRDNLYEFSKFNREYGAEPYFTLGRLQRITKQVLVALEYIHSLWLIHADLKPENILVKSYSRCEVKVIDFGSSCFVDDYLSSYVQSRSYRAPEVMLGLPYDQKIDIWSLGCIVAELWTGYVLFQNDCVQSLLARICGIIGTFPAQMLAAGRLVPKYFAQDGRLFRELEPPKTSDGKSQPFHGGRRFHVYLPKRSSLRQRMRTTDEGFVNFLEFLLTLDPSRRPTANQALGHEWLQPGRYPDGL